MASACVENAAVSAAGYSSYGWSSPRMTLIQEDMCSSSLDREHPYAETQDQVVDFEFCLEDSLTMLSADELFSDGTLVPLKFSAPKTKPSMVNTTTTDESPEVLKSCGRLEMEISDLFSPKAPRCTTRWRELLGLKRLVNAKAHESAKTTSSSQNSKTSSFKQFLHRGSKSKSSSASIASSRLSLSSSSSSSGNEIDDLPRLSLDLNKPTPSRIHNQPRIRLAKPTPPSNPSLDRSSSLAVAADSPRLNASGKIVFHGLERSSSSPGSFTGGPRLKQHHGMPRSYSATPVLNVPVSSLKSGLFFGQLFSSSPSPGSKSQLQCNAKNRTNRTRIEPKWEQ